MNSATIIFIIVLYFLLLYVISYITGKDDSNNIFFKAGRNSMVYCWFGMVGASLWALHLSQYLYLLKVHNLVIYRSFLVILWLHCRMLCLTSVYYKLNLIQYTSF